MAAEGERPIIIKKVKKGGHGGHHGGAWKVAYADFVTAMMAFFLLMWLLNATSSEQKKGISNYFDPVGVSQGATGAGGVMGGKSVKTDGSMQDSTATPTFAPPLGSEGDVKEAEGVPATTDAEEVSPKSVEKPDDQMEKDIEAFEEKKFKEATDALKKAIQDREDLKELADNIIIDQTPEGLRIQIVDQAKKSMFPSGSSMMYSHMQKLLEQVAKIIVRMPNKVSISGHTDAFQYASRSTYTNWELSSDRANASRRILMQSGISAARIAQVNGKAETDPLDKKDPNSPINRRISIVLLRKAIVERMQEKKS